MKTYAIGEFADMVGLSVNTLQRWDREGRLKAGRTPTGRRFYTDEHWQKIIGKRTVTRKRRTVAYVRVSSHAQKPDLQNQQRVLEEFCAARAITVDEWVKEVGGGMNFKRPKFLAIVDGIVSGIIGHLIIAHKDRLVRFGFDLLNHLCRKHDCELIILNSESLSPEQELVQDLMSITHCFSSRLYGLRTYRRRLKEALKQDAQSA